MSITFQAMLIKLLLTFASAWVAFSFVNDNTLGNIFMVAILGTALNYLLGDLVVLPMFGNMIASLGDGLMGAVTAYFYSLFTDFNISFLSLTVFASFIAIGEYFFHQYLLNRKKVAPNRD